jgi:hypothetical protein
MSYIFESIQSNTSSSAIIVGISNSEVVGLMLNILFIFSDSV